MSHEATVQTAASALAARGALDMQRLDFCPECWAAGRRPGGATALISFWKTAVPDAGKKRRPVVDDHVLLDLFNTLEGREAASDAQLRFVLALLLMRKKLLKYDGVAQARTSGGDTGAEAGAMSAPEIWRMLPRQGPPVLVANPDLSPEQIGEVSEQLSAVLAAEA